MSKPEKLLITIGSSMVAGAVLGILYATQDGARIRRKIAYGCDRLFGIHNKKHVEEAETLMEMKEILRSELHVLNDKIEKLSEK